jgi:hypothetical protein
MKVNLHGEPFDKLQKSFVSFYAGVAMLKCIFKNTNDMPQPAKKYMIDMNFNSKTPRNTLEALGTCMFGKKPDETTVDKYTGAVLWKNGKSIIGNRTAKIAKIKSSTNAQLWENIMVLQSRYEVSGQQYKAIRKAMLVWDKLDTDEKAEAINAAYMLIMQSGFDSALEADLVTINNGLMATANVDGTYSLSGYAKKFLKKINNFPLKEDGDIAPDAASVTQGDGCQSTGDVAQKSDKLFGGKLIKRRVKKFKSIKYKDPRKVRDMTSEEQPDEQTKS